MRLTKRCLVAVLPYVFLASRFVCPNARAQQQIPFAVETELRGLPSNKNLLLEVKLYDQPFQQPDPPASLPFWNTTLNILPDSSGQVTFCIGGMGPRMSTPPLPPGHSIGYLLALDAADHVYVTAGPLYIPQLPAGGFTFEAIPANTVITNWKWLYGFCAKQLTGFAQPPAFVPLPKGSDARGFFDVVHLLAGGLHVNGENVVSPFVALSLRLDTSEKRVLFAQSNGLFDLTRPDRAQKVPLTWAVEKRMRSPTWPTLVVGATYLQREHRGGFYVALAEKLNAYIAFSAGATQTPTGFQPTVGLLFELRR